jgi:hypothetical protein
MNSLVATPPPAFLGGSLETQAAADPRVLSDSPTVQHDERTFFGGQR